MIKARSEEKSLIVILNFVRINILFRKTIFGQKLHDPRT